MYILFVCSALVPVPTFPLLSMGFDLTITLQLIKLRKLQVA